MTTTYNYVELCGEIYLQATYNDGSFDIHSDDQTWENGFGFGAVEWEVVPNDDPRITDEVRERLDWIRESE